MILTAITNYYRVHQLSLIERVVMCLGGLRGAVAFSLVLLVKNDIVSSKKFMITSALVIVYFTVFLQGNLTDLLHNY